MIDILLFLFSQFGQLILWLDTIPIYNSLTLLRLLIIFVLLYFIKKVFGGAKND